LKVKNNSRCSQHKNDLVEAIGIRGSTWAFEKVEFYYVTRKPLKDKKGNVLFLSNARPGEAPTSFSRAPYVKLKIAG
jgi:hypothetical protein